LDDWAIGRQKEEMDGEEVAEKGKREEMRKRRDWC
jgi:hypothetical protein